MNTQQIIRNANYWSKTFYNAKGQVTADIKAPYYTLHGKMFLRKTGEQIA